MRLIHGSSTKIEKIDRYSGRFGGFLFFAHGGVHGGEFVYSIEIDEDSIIDPNSFFYREDCDKLNDLVAEVMALVSCDEDTAQELLSQRLHTKDLDIDFKDSFEASEVDWDIQYLTAQAAKVLGYRGVEVPDEHGISWMIDMLDKESELELIG